MSLGEPLLLEDAAAAPPLATYSVKQTHLGFCPEDVIFEIHAAHVTLCYDELPVVVYPFMNLVMWIQSRDTIVLMTQDNMKRIILKTRSARDAKKIVLKLQEVAEALGREMARRELLGLGGSVDLVASMLESEAGMTKSKDRPPALMSTDHKGDKAKAVKEMRGAVSAGGGDSMDDVQTLDFRAVGEHLPDGGEHLEDFRVFTVMQTHLPKVEKVIALRIDREGLTLFSRHTGHEIDKIGWFQLLLWKADKDSVVLVTQGTNRQIRLLTASAEDILKVLVLYATSVREAMELREAQVGFRKELIQFKPVKFKTHSAWTRAAKQSGFMSKMPWGNTENLAESLHTRDQLHAVFSLYDSDQSGSLTSDELLTLLNSLHVDVKPSELMDIMDEMEVNTQQEVEFDGFVRWVLSSDQGAGASTTLRRRIAHKKKEIDVLLELFESIDIDGDGTMDKHEFSELLQDMGLTLNDQEIEYTWRTVDLNGSGEVYFEEFVAWYKKDSVDTVVNNVRQVLRMTKTLTAAKSALVYAVDQGNRQGKKSLRDLFDFLDEDGSANIGQEELLLLIEDLHIETLYKDVLAALDEMDSDGDREVDFDEFTEWWCSTGKGPAGSLRSKLKLAAFTSKKKGAVLTVVETSDEGAEQAEKYMNELLSAAFTQPNEMEGRSLLIFGTENHLRIRCHAIISNPLTDRLLLALIFSNVGLVAYQTPGEADTIELQMINFSILIIFTGEMGMRIIANGFIWGNAAYMTNGWNVFDFFILNSVWLAYVASLFYDVPANLSYSLVMLRSLRALRFFLHIRNILVSIVEGRSMLTAVLLMLLFLFLLFYVVGYQVYAGAMTVECAPMDTNCTLCIEELWTCPESIVCQEDEACFRIAPNITLGTRPEHIDKYGFDNFKQALLSLCMVVTLDDWREIGNEFRTDHVEGRVAAWPLFALAVIALGLFSVNLFAASLAYSYIKTRKRARNLQAQDSAKKNLVERMLNEGKTKAQQQVVAMERHYLQRLRPSWTRRARSITKSRLFGPLITWTVVLNITSMAAVSHDMPPEEVLFFDITEAIFTAIYTVELLIKMQALGFREYFAVLLNKFDFLIVSTSLSTYVLEATGEEGTQGTAVLRLLRLLKLFRAARIAKLIFRNQHIKNMVTKAFAGIESILSLVAFILFALCLFAIAGMNLFYSCNTDDGLSHTPNFSNFLQSIIVVFQVFTADNWGQVMYNTIDCAGYSAAAYFVAIVCICYFVLGNLFVAIFMENLEIDDEEKRDKQVLAYMESLAGDEDGEGGLANLHKAMDSVSKILSETSNVNVLERKGPKEFMRAARLVQTGVQISGKGVGKIGRIAATKAMEKASDSPTPDGTLSPGGMRMEQMGGMRASVQATMMDGSDKMASMQQSIQPGNAQARGSEYAIQAVGPTLRERVQGVLSHPRFRLMQVIIVFLSMTHAVLDPNLVKDAVAVASTTLINSDHSDVMTDTGGYAGVLMLIDVVVFIFFFIEILANTYVYSLCAGPDSVLQKGRLTFELALVVVQFLMAVQIPYARGALALRALRILYLVHRFEVMIAAFLASLSAVWTILVLMAATFLAFGIVAMNMYSGRLWHCEGAEWLDKDPCDAEHLVNPAIGWNNRDYHFDNIFESMSSLFIVWSLQGWSTLWYWCMDVTTDTSQAPLKDNTALESFYFMLTFVIWNSFMLTRLFTGMLCDFFSQSSGSMLMTSEQRNWQFMSMFLLESLKHELSRPEDGTWALKAFLLIRNGFVQFFLGLTIIASVVSMLGQQSVMEEDPTGVTKHILLLLDECVLGIFTVEALVMLRAFGVSIYFREYRAEVLVLIAMWITVCHSIAREEFGLHWLHWVQSVQFVRGLRLITVFRQVHAIKKIYFLLHVAMPQVLNLIGIMSIVFFVLGCSAHHLCHDLPRGETITEMDNFDTVLSSMMLLFQVTTGQSLMGVTTACRAVNGPGVVLFFIGFFVATNMLLVNLFIALLLDNFDLMGSEDMAVSDMDIELFKRTWVECGLDIHHSVNVAELESFVTQDGMGTFSMMPKADKHYMNRVMFELDVTYDEVRTGKKEVAFFPLILALCHIRFSSSCLSIADEVDKSQRLVARHEDHAARIIQVQSRAFLSWRNPPRWVTFDKKNNAKELELKKLLESQGETHQLIRSETKITWDCAVAVGALCCMHSLVKTDRITPEHVAAEAFSRLQELVDKGTESQKLMRVHSGDDRASLMSRMTRSSGMLRSSDDAKNAPKRQLSRQTTTDFSRDEQQEEDFSSDEESGGKKGRFGRKKKKKKKKKKEKKEKDDEVTKKKYPLMNQSKAFDTENMPLSFDTDADIETGVVDRKNKKKSKKGKKDADESPSRVALKSVKGKEKGEKKGKDTARMVGNLLTASSTVNMTISTDPTSDDGPSSDDASDDGKSARKKAKVENKKEKKAKKAAKQGKILKGQNPLQGGNKQNPLQREVSTDDEDKEVDAKFAYEAKGPHAHWLAETYTAKSVDIVPVEEKKEESFKAKRARKKLEKTTRQLQEIEDRNDGIVSPGSQEGKGKFRMSAIMHAPTMGDSDSDEEEEKKAAKVVPDWIIQEEPEPEPEPEREPEPESENMKKKKKREKKEAKKAKKKKGAKEVAEAGDEAADADEERSKINSKSRSPVRLGDSNIDPTSDDEQQMVVEVEQPVLEIGKNGKPKKGKKAKKPKKDKKGQKGKDSGSTVTTGGSRDLSVMKFANPLMSMSMDSMGASLDSEADGVPAYTPPPTTDTSDGLGSAKMQLGVAFQAPSQDNSNTRATAADVAATLDFKKKKAFMSRKTTMS